MKEWNDEPREKLEMCFDENSDTKCDLFFVFWSLPESINSVCLKCFRSVVPPFPPPMPGLNNNTTEISQIRYDLFDMAGCDFISQRYN